MIVTERRSGLLLAGRAATPRHVREQLAALDADLCLAQEVDDRWGRFVWQVFKRQGDRPAVWLFDWRADPEDPASEPLELSSQIVAEAGSRRLGSRRVFDHEAAERDRERRDAEARAVLFEEVRKEAEGRHGRLPCFHRGMYLRGRG